MVYDFEGMEDHNPPKVTDYIPDPKDLEVIVTMLQVAAIFLTDVPDAIFTQRQLLDQVRELCGEEFVIDEKDILIVLSNAAFLQKYSGQRFSLK